MIYWRKWKCWNSEMANTFWLEPRLRVPGRGPGSSELPSFLSLVPQSLGLQLWKYKTNDFCSLLLHICSPLSSKHLNSLSLCKFNFDNWSLFVYLAFIFTFMFGSYFKLQRAHYILGSFNIRISLTLAFVSR